MFLEEEHKRKAEVKKMPKKPIIDKEMFKRSVLYNVKTLYRKTLEEATDQQIFQAVSYAVKDAVVDHWITTQEAYDEKDPKTVYYMSMEFLMGRALGNNMINLMAYKEFSEALAELGLDINTIEDQEPDAALGNGGLGRLAACYLDSMTTLEIPATGYSICYELGIFKQRIIDGWQTETPDYWLPGGSVWLTSKPDRTVPVHFGGRIEEGWQDGHHTINHVDYQTIYAVPYDMYVPGFQGEGVAILRLWKAQSPGFDMESFNRGDYINAMGCGFRG